MNDMVVVVVNSEMQDDLVHAAVVIGLVDILIVVSWLLVVDVLCLLDVGITPLNYIMLL